MDILINLLSLINVTVIFINNPIKEGVYSSNKVITINKNCLYKHNVLKHEFVHALQHYVWEFDILPLPNFIVDSCRTKYAETVLINCYTQSIDRSNIDQHNEYQAICCELATIEELVELFYKHVKQ